MKKILAFAGSTSSTSINKKLATYAASLLNDTEFEVIDMNDYNVPLFSEDEEKNGFPNAIKELAKKLHSVDGFIVSLAEHNGSYAAAYKNTTDWLSRVERNMFNGKPMLLMATSPGGRGGVGVLAAAKAYYPHAGAQVVEDFSLPKFYDNFQEGRITEEELNETLKTKVVNFESVL
ncbi:NAD(P)H-dependent oxidoreductase [Pseudotenacibaculum sp. MALMAid0570]|uniref:NADPH-dependent FMN reductase n=1 Tax=Pseudotenacibaculum sp. MALMAid0570 TaxID=3143938 RepID=UPI0032DFDABD